jgi:hypothetical protein
MISKNNLLKKIQDLAGSKAPSALVSWNRKAQLKIQEMAFVLVAIFIFFGIILLIFVAFQAGSLKDLSQETNEDKTKELLRSISGTPELLWAGCVGCVDLDKALVLKGQSEKISELLELNYLKIERVYPDSGDGECSFGNYPLCEDIVLIDNKEFSGIASEAWVNLCRWDANKDKQICELGKIIASGSGLNAN